MNKEEIKQIIHDVTEDCKNFPVAVRAQQLREAGWVSDPSGDIWLPPAGSVPYRPYMKYSAWKKMREGAGHDAS